VTDQTLRIDAAEFGQAIRAARKILRHALSTAIAASDRLPCGLFVRNHVARLPVCSAPRSQQHLAGIWSVKVSRHLASWSQIPGAAEVSDLACGEARFKALSSLGGETTEELDEVTAAGIEHPAMTRRSRSREGPKRILRVMSRLSPELERS